MRLGPLCNSLCGCSIVDVTDRMSFYNSVSAEIMCWEGDSTSSHTT